MSEIQLINPDEDYVDSGLTIKINNLIREAITGGTYNSNTGILSLNLFNQSSISITGITSGSGDVTRLDPIVPGNNNLKFVEQVYNGNKSWENLNFSADFDIAKQNSFAQFRSAKQLVTVTGYPQFHGSCIVGEYIYFGVRPISTLTPSSIVRMRLDNLSSYTAFTFTFTQLGSAEQLTYVPEKGKIIVAHNNRFNDLNVSAIDPITLKDDLVINDVAIGYPVRFPTTVSDGTYLYVIMGGSANDGNTLRIRRYRLSDYSFVNELNTGILAYGHAAKYDGYGSIYVTTSYRVTIPTQQYVIRIDTGTFTVVDQGALIGESYTDDMVLLGDYVYCGMEYIFNTPGQLTIAKANRSNLSDVKYFTFPAIIGSTYGLYSDGKYLWILAATTPGYIIRVDPETLLTNIYQTPTGEEVPNEILTDTKNYYVAYWGNPAKVAKYNQFPFQQNGFLKSGATYVYTDITSSSNQGLITLSGDVTGSGTTGITTTVNWSNGYTTYDSRYLKNSDFINYSANTLSIVTANTALINTKLDKTLFNSYSASTYNLITGSTPTIDLSGYLTKSGFTAYSATTLSSITANTALINNNTNNFANYLPLSAYSPTYISNQPYSYTIWSGDTISGATRQAIGNKFNTIDNTLNTIVRIWQDYTWSGNTIDLTNTTNFLNIKNVFGNQIITYSSTGLTSARTAKFVIDKETGSTINISLPVTSIIYLNIGVNEGSLNNSVVSLSGATGSKYLFEVAETAGFYAVTVTKMTSDSPLNNVKVLYSQTARKMFSDASGATGTDVTMYSITIPANTLGAGSILKLTYIVTPSTSANTKTFKVYDQSAGSTNGLISSSFTSGAGTGMVCNEVIIANQTSSSQIYSKTNTTGTKTLLALDWTVTRTIIFSTNINNLTEVTSAWDCILLEQIN